MVLGRITALLISGITLFSCQNEQIRCPDHVQTLEFEEVERKSTSAEELMRYANRIQRLSSNEITREIFKLESKPSQQRSFDDSIKLALLLSHSDLSSRNDRRALDVLATIDSNNFAEDEFISFLSNLLEERVASCHQTQCDESVKSSEKSNDTLLREKIRLKSELDEERKHREELQEQLKALMKLEENIIERETQDNNEQ